MQVDEVAELDKTFVDVFLSEPRSLSVPGTASGATPHSSGNDQLTAEFAQLRWVAKKKGLKGRDRGNVISKFLCSSLILS